MFEAGHTHKAEARDFVKLLTSTPELRALYKHSGDTLSPKADAVPLQAADDLLAYETVSFSAKQ